MSLLYVNENGATIGVEANKCVVQYRDGMKKMIPIESLEVCGGMYVQRNLCRIFFKGR